MVLVLNNQRVKLWMTATYIIHISQMEYSIILLGGQTTGIPIEWIELTIVRRNLTRILSTFSKVARISFALNILANHALQGDAIYYYGDRGPNNHAPAMVYIDGDDKGDMVLSNSSSAQYQQLLWSKSNLGPGDHEIVISNAGSDGQVMGLDYLVIESDHGFTSAGAGPYVYLLFEIMSRYTNLNIHRAASSIPPEAIIVDDNDLNLITYTGWDTTVYVRSPSSIDHIGSNLPSQSSRGRFFHYKNTMHRTNQPGSFLTFKFNGTAVWYIAGLFPDNGMVNITLDNESAVMINGSSGSNASLTQRIIWNATELPNREHTVVIKHQDIAGLHVTLDYFSVPQPAPRASLPIPVIVGSTLGGAALLALSIVWYMLMRRRRTSNVTIDDQSNSNHLNDRPRPLFNPTNEAMSQSLSLQPHWGYPLTPCMHQQAPCRVIMEARLPGASQVLMEMKNHQHTIKSTFSIQTRSLMICRGSVSQDPLLSWGRRDYGARQLPELLPGTRSQNFRSSYPGHYHASKNPELPTGSVQASLLCVRFHLSSTTVNTNVDGDRVAEVMTIRKTLDCCGSKVKTVFREFPPGPYKVNGVRT
ncbi:hypothetical protein AG1IA_08741 [Rhizoctonia solani AG-1 IA]|uniref:Uncharacterized protein n=1 Tax=Thanatephorus cucumeris (strain AG1-IA) TaxID=983506 RepID=L8WH35_THACA|nr:hypothetical protein AG1IA_08741 [Rhizoctonia solani AG-1 IA]